MAQIEDFTARRGSASEFSDKTPEEIIHELRVHQIELEIQNEELKRVQLALEESRNNYQDKYRDLYDFAPVGYFTLTSKGIIREVNLAGAMLLGMTRSKLIGRGFGYFVVPESLNHWDRHILSVLGHEEKQSCDLTLKSKDGSSFYARLESIRINAPAEQQREDSDGHVILTAVSDITEQKRVTELIREREKRFRLFYESSPLAYQSLDVDGRFIEINQAWLDMMGYERSAVIGKWFGDFLVPEHAELFRQRFVRFFELGEARNVEFTMIHQSGKFIRAIFDGNIGYDEYGTPVQTHCVLKDITEIKQLEEERLEMERKLLAAQKLESLSIMAAGIAHDFNNQLAVVLGNLELALTDQTLDPETLLSIESAIGAARRSAELSRQMQVYTGNIVYFPVDIDLNELLNRNPTLKSTVSKYGALNFETNSALPIIKGDAEQLQRLVMNILVNASEAIADRDGYVTLRTGFMDCDAAYLRRSRLEEKPAPGGFVFLEVSDTGCGMDVATQHKLFDPFYSTKFTGRGLGMAEVMGTIKGHQGAIIVESECGKGTTVRLLFPALEKAPASPVQAMDLVVTKAPALETVNRRKTILLIEDEAGVRDLVVRRLDLLGYDSIIAEDGEEGVSVFRERMNEIDLVMLDYKMPKMNGVEAFGELIRIKPDVKVILSSGYTEDVVIESFPGRRPACVLHKPYNMDDLKVELDRLLGTEG